MHSRLIKSLNIKYLKSKNSFISGTISKKIILKRTIKDIPIEKIHLTDIAEGER